MIKSKIKNFTTLNDVLSFIKEEPDWGPNYSNIIVAALKARRKSDALKIKSTLSVGSTVGVAGRFEYWLGTVTKVMKTRCAVTKMNDGRSYSVPMSMLDVKEAA